LLGEPQYLVRPLVIVAGVIGAGFLFLTWWLPQVLMRNGSTCSKWRVAMLAIYLPIHWIMIAFVVGVPTYFVMALIVVVFGSMGR
jgi:hypothetical protein